MLVASQLLVLVVLLVGLWLMFIVPSTRSRHAISVTVLMCQAHLLISFQLPRGDFYVDALSLYWGFTVALYLYINGRPRRGNKDDRRISTV